MKFKRLNVYLIASVDKDGSIAENFIIAENHEKALEMVKTLYSKKDNFKDIGALKLVAFDALIKDFEYTKQE